MLLILKLFKEGIWHKNEYVDGKELIVHIYDTYDKVKRFKDGRIVAALVFNLTVFFFIRIEQT